MQHVVERSLQKLVLGGRRRWSNGERSSTEMEGERVQAMWVLLQVDASHAGSKAGAAEHVKVSRGGQAIFHKQRDTTRRAR